MKIILDKEYANDKVFIVDFTPYNRKLGVISGYRPDWISEGKPDYNCGCLVSFSSYMLYLDVNHICALMPLKAELWDNVKVGDDLYAMEGPNEVGCAEVIGIIGEK